MKQSISLAFGGMFLGLFLMLLRFGFSALNVVDLAATAFAAIVFLGLAAFPKVFASRSHPRAKSSTAFVSPGVSKS